MVMRSGELTFLSLPQDGVHLPPAGGARESFPGGALPRRVRAGDARHEDGAARGQNSGSVRPHLVTGQGYGF